MYLCVHIIGIISSIGENHKLFIIWLLITGSLFIYIFHEYLFYYHKKRVTFCTCIYSRFCNRVAFVKELNIGEIQIHFCLPSDNTSNYGWEGCGGHGTYR